MMIREITASLLLVSGSLFVLIAAIGIIKFNDIYTRMHASVKASAFGIFLILIGINIMHFSFPILIKSLIILLFTYITSPLASHMLGRAAHKLKIRQSGNTRFDELIEPKEETN